MTTMFIALIIGWTLLFYFKYKKENPSFKLSEWVFKKYRKGILIFLDVKKPESEGRILRFKYGKWFIQCQASSLIGDRRWISWSGLVPSKDVLHAPEPAYFQVALTEKQAVENLLDELDSL